MVAKPSTEFALAAAARVSYCAALLTAGACTPSSSSSATPQDAASNASEAGTPAVIVEPDPYLSDADRAAAEAASNQDPELAAFERCDARLRAATNAGNMPASPENKACCQSVADSMFQPMADEEATNEGQLRVEELWYTVQFECCTVLDHGPGACTPWGPPTPPSPSHHARGPDQTDPPAWLDLRELARAQVPDGLEAQVARGTDELRAAAITTWRARMVNEHGSAPVMAGLLGQLEGLARSGQLETHALARARSFADDERRHGILCGAVVEALGGRAEAQALPTQPFPDHDDAATKLEAALRNLISICCLSETVAVALIAAERYEMPAGPLRELLTRIWADECGHAKVGWRLLPTLLGQADAATLTGLGEYLRLAFKELETHELAHLPAHVRAPIGGECYGLCDGAEARELFYATVERVIIPGLEARGLPARRAWDQRRAVELSRLD